MPENWRIPTFHFRKLLANVKTDLNFQYEGLSGSYFYEFFRYVFVRIWTLNAAPQTRRTRFAVDARRETQQMLVNGATIAGMVCHGVAISDSHSSHQRDLSRRNSQRTLSSCAIRLPCHSRKSVSGGMSLKPFSWVHDTPAVRWATIIEGSVPIWPKWLLPVWVNAK